MGSPDNISFTIIWDDEQQLDNLQEQTVQLP